MYFVVLCYYLDFSVHWLCKLGLAYGIKCSKKFEGVINNKNLQVVGVWKVNKGVLMKVSFVGPFYVWK